MRISTYTGTEKAEAVERLAIGLAGMQVPTLVVRFGQAGAEDQLALWGSVMPVDVVRLRLPGLDLPSSHTPMDKVAIQTAVAVLDQMMACGAYRLVILDGIQALISEELLDGACLRRLIRSASEQTQVAVT